MRYLIILFILVGCTPVQSDEELLKIQKERYEQIKNQLDTTKA